MSPPAAADRLPGNGIGQGWNWASTALQNDAVLFYEADGSIRGNR